MSEGESQEPSRSRPAPLSDVRVCDLTQNLAGPYCTQILADLGASVVKVEPPGGDLARAWGPPFWGRGSALYLSANRGKRSIVVDLKRPEGMALLHRIVAESDVFVHASRPGAARRLGIDYAAMRAVRDDLVYMGISAYGTEGPLAESPGYDPLMQAYSGIMSLTGHPGTPPTRVGGAVIDYGTGMWAATAILAALRERDRTGEGVELGAALLDTAIGWVSYHIAGYLGTGKVPVAMGSGLSAIAPYQAFPTADGHVMILAGNDGLFRRLCRMLDLPGLADDERFLTNPERVENRDALTELLERRTRELTTAAVVERGIAHDVPVSAIHTIDQVVEDEQIGASEMIPYAPHGELDDYRDVSLPLRIAGERPRAALPPPDPGAHTLQLLDDLGYDPEEVAALLDSGVVSAE